MTTDRPGRGLTRALSLALAAGALSGCGAADAGLPPQGVSRGALASTPQAFAARALELAFRDPDRRRKLAQGFARIDEIAAEEMQRQHLPGLAVGVVVDGELAYAKGFGVADEATGRRPDADTVYRIGSITKSFTAATLLSLRDDGLVSFDDPLARWIPEAGRLVYPTDDSPPITLRQLLTHTSGLPRGGPLDANRGRHGPSEGELTRSLGGLRLENPPGTRHVYSNLGFALLGVIVGRAAHAPFREVVTRRVIAPLGMTSTTWDRASVPADRLATAYAKGPGDEHKPIDQLPPGADDGAGGIYSTVRDMARYLAFQLAAYPARSGPETGPVRRSSVREGHFNALWDSFRIHPRHAPSKGESLVDAVAARYGYGWVVEQTCDFDELVWHNGGIDGYRTDVAFLPEQGVGVIALVNMAGASPEAVVGRALGALRKTGGLARREGSVSPTFTPVVTKLLAVYNRWDEALYASMLTPGRGVPPAEEQAELAGYHQLHGACRGFTPLAARGVSTAVFHLDCERGALEMEVSLAPDGLIAGFAGTSRELPVPPELRRVAEPVAGLVTAWDDAVFDRHLGHAGRSRTDAMRLFADLRSEHGACAVASLEKRLDGRRVILSCDEGGDLALVLGIGDHGPDAEVVTSYAFESLGGSTCPVR